MWVLIIGLPLYGSPSAKGAYHGAVDIVEAAIKVGVKKIIATSTAVSLLERECLKL
jgi:hypothetical protein